MKSSSSQAGPVSISRAWGACTKPGTIPTGFAGFDAAGTVFDGIDIGQPVRGTTNMVQHQ